MTASPWRLCCCNMSVERNTLSNYLVLENMGIYLIQTPRQLWTSIILLLRHKSSHGALHHEILVYLQCVSVTMVWLNKCYSTLSISIPYNDKHQNILNIGVHLMHWKILDMWNSNIRIMDIHYLFLTTNINNPFHLWISATRMCDHLKLRMLFIAILYDYANSCIFITRVFIACS